jgi:tetratricopeptide (TPR) repeat protein
MVSVSPSSHSPHSPTSWSLRQMSSRLLLCALLLVFSPLLEGGTTHVAVLVIRLFILALLVCYLTDTTRNLVPWRPVGVRFLWVFLVIGAVSTASSAYRHQSLQWLVVLCSYAALFHLVRVYAAGREQVLKLMAILGGMAVFEAGWALVEGALTTHARPSATFANPNFLAGYLAAIATMLCGHALFAHKGWRTFRRVLLTWRLAQVLCVLVMGLCITAIVWTASRGAMVALMSGLSVVLALRYGRKGMGVAAVLLVILVSAAVPLRERIYLEHLYNPLAYARWDMWQSSWAMVKDYPMGIGPGLYQYLYPRYALPIVGHVAQYGWTAQTAHSEYVQMAVELGVGAVMVFGWGVVSVGRGALTLLRQRLGRKERGAVVGIAGALVGMLVHAAVDSNFHQPAIALLAVLCAGVLLPLKGEESGGRREPSGPPAFPRLAAGAMILFIVSFAVLTIRFGAGWVLYDMGKREFDQKRPAQALSYYQRALIIDEGKALYHNAAAAALFAMFQESGNLDSGREAVTELQSAIGLNPLDGRLLALLGHVYATMALAPLSADQIQLIDLRNEWRRLAVLAYEKAAQLEPFTVTHYVELGQLKVQAGEISDGEKAFLHAVSVEPNYLPAREWLFKVYLKLDRIEEAEDMYREIVERRQKYLGYLADPHGSQYLQVDTDWLRNMLNRARQDKYPM